MNETTRKLQEMLAQREDSEIIAGETGVRATVTTINANTNEIERVDSVVTERGVATPDYTSGVYTGRGPTGRLRNFRAMSDAKFERESAIIRSENNDPEAIAAIDAEYNRRQGI